MHFEKKLKNQELEEPRTKVTSEDCKFLLKIIQDKIDYPKNMGI
jgi:hypothetical protein